MSTAVLVTRPAAEAVRWQQALSARGFAARALPLIDIAPATDTAALRAAGQRLADCMAVMFVSVHAVQHWFEQNGAPAQSGSASNAIETRAWSPGPGTSRALLAHGWPADRLDEPAADAAQFDSEALWSRVQPQVQAGRRVLIVRGGDAQGRSAGRAWLADRLREAGVQVDEVVAYRRLPPVWSTAQQQQASAAAADGSVWVFSSSEAIANLGQLLPGRDWRAARAVATHPRIEQAARALGFGDVRASRPALDDVAASIESFG